MKDDYKDIGPYEGQDFEDAISRLRQYPQLLNNFVDIISRHNRFYNKWKFFHAKKMLANLLGSVHNYLEFQDAITCDLFLEMIESSSIDEFTVGGIDDLGSEPHIFISNHRDIVLDAALLDLALYRNNKNKGEMVIGDNLLVNQFTTDMFKVNGGITIKRSGSSASEIKEQTLKVSRYIRYCIEEKKRSVWIAQKSGRSKDGIDNTSTAIIKMLYLAYKEDGISFDEFIKRSSICPIAISYQYDPCDVTKSEEQIRKLKAEGCYNVYKKKKYADVLDLVRGMRMNKGNVHLQIGTPLDSATINDALKATREIDRQIHTGYRLWDTNYYAFDKVNGTNIYADKYKDMNTKAFDKHCKYLKEDVKQYLYQSYANPVVSMRMEEELNEAK